jgi:hypothetical protein
LEKGWQRLDIVFRETRRTTIKSPLPEGGGDLVKGKIGDTRYI